MSSKEEEATSSDLGGPEAPESESVSETKPVKKKVSVKWEETPRTRLARNTSTKPGHAHHAYTLVENPDKPGHHFAVHLTDVTFKECDVLEPNECSESMMRGVARVENAIAIRSRRGTWGSDKRKKVTPIKRKKKDA